MYANEFKTKEKQKLTEINNMQHVHAVMATQEAFTPLCLICVFAIRFFEFCKTHGQLSIRRNHN